MKLATITAGGRTFAARAHGESYALIAEGDVGDLIRDADWRQRAASATDLRPASEVTVQQLIRNPSKVMCVGHNYGEHVAELSRNAPEYPDMFVKFADTLTGPASDIFLPEASTRPDWEVELAVIIGATVWSASAAEATAAVAGYTVANDVSLRGWQRRTSQFLPGKAFHRSTPLGPVMVTADDFDPSESHELTCAVNGEQVQRGLTSDLRFDVPTIISFISTFATLNPGDVILTGTPSGVGAAMKPPRQLNDGDVLTSRVEGIGSLTNRCHVASR